jgi:hypothetical protein
MPPILRLRKPFPLPLSLVIGHWRPLPGTMPVLSSSRLNTNIRGTSVIERGKCAKVLCMRPSLPLRQVLLIWLLLNHLALVDSAADEKFKYRNRKVEFDSFKDLFGQKGIGLLRRALFEKYLLASPEGRQRAEQCHSTKAEAVWRTLAIEEKSTFLAIATALGNLQIDSGGLLLEGVESLEEIHGEARFASGERFMNNEAFRIYVKFQPAALAHIVQGTGKFKNLCTKNSFGYDGLGSRHPDVCRPEERSENQRATDNHPRLHFNFTPSTRCVDIDIDYERGLLHLTRDNSNVLAGDHLRTFEKEYCEPGFGFD